MRLRNPDVAPALIESGPETTDGQPANDSWAPILVTDTETAASLEFAAVEGVERAEQFLEETDFDSETLYVEQHPIRECYEQQLCWVRWTESSIETAYSRGYRDADIACETDAYDVVAQLVRLPVVFDVDELRSHGSRTQSGPCRPPTTPENPEEEE
ncbi:hypothetical protein AUR64_03290 [Haloprofundus marisrubri]|uniref:Uncharacterized protein n=1 Tax=Haloprofundus marisrubri TaxID=1514971 RepID=A0A0W1RDR3_9EURY|nr:hypothetical protein AUR64_03290 [Haloprofundus marisrubri]